MKRAALAALFLLGCRAQPAPDRTAASAAPLPASAPSATPVASAPASAASAAPRGLPPPAPLAAPACCRLDRTEGHYGPESGVHSRYSGDVLLRKDGKRLLYPYDLVSDTMELFQFAQSSGKSLDQERRLRVVGEGQRFVSVEVDDRGETGAGTPFFHSKCRTVDLHEGRTQKLDEVFGKAADALLADGQRAFDAAPGHEAFRFLPASFAVLGPPGARRLRFCAPPRDEKLGLVRFDVEVSVPGELP